VCGVPPTYLRRLCLVPKRRLDLGRLCAYVAWLLTPPRAPGSLPPLYPPVGTVIYNMHRIFLVKELVSAVLQFLEEDGKGSLAAIACSCRALSDMALDELWAEAEF
jgi:hypothetical protein